MGGAGHDDSALIIKRILPAPPEAVFAAWTDPARLSRWMSPYGDASATLDLQIGGGFTIVMHGQGRAIEHTGEYRDIDPQQLPPGQADSHRGGWGGILEHLDAYLRGAVSPLREA